MAERARAPARVCSRCDRIEVESYICAMVLVLASSTKQFKDSNFNVLKAAFGGVRTVLGKAAGRSLGKQERGAVAIVLSPAIEKLGDRKLQVIKAQAVVAGLQIGREYLPR